MGFNAVRSVMELPLAQRELRQVGRDRRTYILRAALAGGAVAVLYFTWFIRSFTIMAMSRGQGNLTGGAEVLGQSLAITAQGVQLLATFLIAPIVSAGLICTERQEGTLGLLLMADLSGRDVFFAKFLRAFLFIELLLISMLPFTAFASLLGGVSVPDVAAGLLVLTFYAAAICSLGLFFSALARRPAMAFFLTVIATLAWVGLTYEIDLRLLPALGITQIRLSVLALFSDFLRYDDILTTIVPQAVAASVVGIVAALLTIRLLPRLVAPAPASRRSSRPAQRSVWRRELFNNPGARIVASGSTGFISGIRPWPLRIPVFFILVGLSAIPGCGSALIVKSIMFYDILSSLYASKRDGSLDELILTPLPDHALARSIFIACLRTAIFYGLAGAVATGGMALYSLSMGRSIFFLMGNASQMQLLSALDPTGILQILLQILGVALTALIPIAASVSGAAIAAYIGTERGTPVSQTVTAMAVSLFVSAALTFIYYISLAFLQVFTATRSTEAFYLSSLATQLLHVGCQFLVAFAFFSMLSDSVRRRLASQAAIYVPTVQHAPGRMEL
jgi:ABC-type transport system involved in multi-copper enzyme maturation permease subunit